MQGILQFFKTQEKPFTKKWFNTYAHIVLGTFILATGYALFMSPYKIVPGGIYGISIVLHHTFHTPLGVTALCFNIPLTLLGLRILGPKFGAKTFVCLILTACFTDLVNYSIPFLFDNPDDPFKLGEQIILASIFGGIVMGIGVGLMFKARASSGGTDVIASILGKWTKIPLGQQLMIVDSIIVLIGFAVFRDWKIPMCSWITIFFMGKIIDMVLNGFTNEKAVFIISDKSNEIREKIIHDVKRGGTIFSGKGMYKQTDKEVIYMVASRKEVSVLQEYVYEIDPHAFMSIFDASEILGKGFKSLEEKIKN